ncbi:hypothetical protein IEQ34_011813 [Dendrobium chrysotoxum]|uniref:LAGLIDADG homing endonuclease n=1 Tax=Dendrobium chrysotoxum TaxID=161865 RepID=A0AAV7GB24_DENCH|nr:hypothetical protein IEQ34_011813 [Dendrobium chrysotoxum]
MHITSLSYIEFTCRIWLLVGLLSSLYVVRAREKDYEIDKDSLGSGYDRYVMIIRKNRIKVNNCNGFSKGLNRELRHSLAPLKIQEFFELVEQARLI